MPLILRALGDPAAHQRDLLRRDVPIRFRRRHHVVAVVGLEAGDHLALIRLAGDDRRVPTEVARRFLRLIEAQFGLAVLRVLAVAVKAGLREDGADVAVELDLVRPGASQPEQHEERAAAEEGYLGEDAHG